MEKNFKEFLDVIPEKQDITKTISLYSLIKKECPNTIKNLNKKIYGKSIFLPKKEEGKWYTHILNYLIKKEVLETDRNEIGLFHDVNEEYLKYFLVPKSTIFSLNNKEKHLILYKQQSKEFLKKTGLVDKDGNEFIKPKTKKTYQCTDKQKKWIKIISTIVLCWTILQYLLMFSKYGFDNMIELTLNIILFVISLLLIIQE